MEKSTRMWLAIGTVFCGVLAAVSWCVAIYAFKNTPGMQDMVVNAANGGQSIQSKSAFLFAPPAFATFYFLMLLNPLARWKSVVRKATEKAVPKDLWTDPTIGRFRFATVALGVTVGLCVASGMTLSLVVERAVYLLSK